MTQSEKDKPIFETFNWYRSFGVLIARLFCLGIVISAAVNFNQNHVVTSIAMIVFGFLFFWIGQQSITVYHDRFEYRWGSLFHLLDIHKKTYFYKDIKSISIDGVFTQTFDMIENVLTDAYLGAWNAIDIEFKDGKRKSIKTRIYKADLSKAVKIILQEFRRYNNFNRLSG